MKVVLRHIAGDQGVEISERALEHIAENANGDMRAAIRDLQAVSLGALIVGDEDADVMDSRLSTKSMYDLMERYFTGAMARRQSG